MTADVSIITSTLNAASDFRPTAESIRAIKGVKAEWIVIDGLSTDGTADVIRENKDVIEHTVFERDHGIYDAWNKGIALAEGKWLMFLGAGDLIDAEWPAEVVARGCDYGFVYGDLDLLATVDGSLASRKRSNEWSLALRQLGDGLPIPHVATAHHHRLFRGGGFNSGFRILGDWDFLARHRNESGLYIKGQRQATMRLGGVSNHPRSIAARRLERAEILRQHHLHMSTRKRLALWSKETLIADSKLFPTIQSYWHRVHR